jgi:hypothetical protein
VRPLQVWLPSINTRLSLGDCNRAFTEWKGEQTVWLMPDLERTKRWKEESAHTVAIPAERLDRVELYHVGANGYAVGIGAAQFFPNCRTDGLLDAWLNPAHRGRLDIYLAPESVRMEIPFFSAKHVDYKWVNVQIGPIGLMPIAEFNHSTGAFLSGWPPEGVHFKTVSPDGESEHLLGPFIGERHDGIPTAVSLKTGDRSWWVYFRWPGPLGALILESAGMDVLLAQRRMAAIAKQSETDIQGALVRARDESLTYISDGHSNMGSSWFWPAYLGNGEKAVLFSAEDFGVEVKDISELQANPVFRAEMSKRVEIRRVWGPLGLFWALLLERLEQDLPFTSCRECGRVLSGIKLKRFCDQGENPSCYGNRRAADKRKLREKARARPKRTDR